MARQKMPLSMGRIRSASRPMLPPLTFSNEVSPQMREYERFNTVVANAYIKPLMASYLGRLEERLSIEGVTCRIFKMHSGGGITSLGPAICLMQPRGGFNRQM